MERKEKHHLWYPRKAYRKSKVAWAFRSLSCHIQMVTREQHVEIHRNSTPPKMPSEEEMHQKIDACKDCKGKCITHSERIDYILGLIDDTLGE